MIPKSHAKRYFVFVKGTYIFVRDPGYEQTISDDDCKELETRVCGVIRLNLVDDIAYPLLQIKSPPKLWAKLENFYMTKSFTNKWYLKKQLYFMKMVESESLQTHLNRFNKAVTDLLSVDIKVDLIWMYL